MNLTALRQPSAVSTSALLSISGLDLVLPQTDIRALEAASDVDSQDAKPLSAGWIGHAQQRWPVYCLSAELSLLVEPPGERRACVLLNDGAGLVGILCDEVRIIKQAAPERRHELPLPMHLPDTPVIELIMLEKDTMACLTSAARLVTHIIRQTTV